MPFNRTLNSRKYDTAYVHHLESHGGNLLSRVRAQGQVVQGAAETTRRRHTTHRVFKRPQALVRDKQIRTVNLPRSRLSTSSLPSASTYIRVCVTHST